MIDNAPVQSRVHVPASGPRAAACAVVVAELWGNAVAAHAAGRGSLEEIVVTAQRQAVAKLATPLSIDRIAGADLDLTGATHSSEALNRIPGAMIQRGSGQESLTAIRSPVLTGAGSCGAFLFLENGVPVRPTGFCNVNEMFEINTEQADAIEVLRGTGSALYGSNAVHGTVNVLQDAPADLPRAGVDLTGGPSDYGRLGVVASRDGDGDPGDRPARRVDRAGDPRRRQGRAARPLAGHARGAGRPAVYHRYRRPGERGRDGRPGRDEPHQHASAAGCGRARHLRGVLSLRDLLQALSLKLELESKDRYGHAA